MGRQRSIRQCSSSRVGHERTPRISRRSVFRQVDRKLLMQLAETTFTEEAHNVAIVGGTGSGKSHLAIAIGVSAIEHHGKRVRFHSTVDLVNALELGWH